MKIWLNNLKEGDIFYHIMLNHVYKCKHCGDANNPNFRMSRVKFEILDENDMLKELFGTEHEAFVNQYVYDDYEEALADLRTYWQKELTDVQSKQISLKARIKELEEREQQLTFMILEYDKTHNDQNKGE